MFVNLNSDKIKKMLADYKQIVLAADELYPIYLPFSF